MREFFTNVVGVTKKNDDGSSRQDNIVSFVKKGMPAVLIREPDNKFDKNAVGVWVEASSCLFGKANHQIGYLDARLAGELAPLLDSGIPVEAEVVDTTGGPYEDKENYGVNLKIRKPD